jgi:ferredoxin
MGKTSNNNIFRLYRLFHRPPFFLRSETWMRDKENIIGSGPNSRKAIMVLVLVLQYAGMGTVFNSLRILRPHILPLLRGMRESARSIIRNPASHNRELDSSTIAELEEYAKKLGISDIGYTKLNHNFIFKDFSVLFDRAIIFSMKMNQKIVDTNPSQEASREFLRTYMELGDAVNSISDFLRRKGYSCMASHSMGGCINTVPTAMDANLGFIGRNGILISPGSGPCIRLAAVLINAETLPFAGDNEHKWISDYCESCLICIKECPGGAILSEPIILKDGERVYIDPEKCAPEFARGCSLCISRCPFTGGQYDKIKTAWINKQEIQND